MDWQAISVILAAVAIVFGWLRWLLSGKANRESTDARFNELIKQLDRQAERMDQHAVEDRDMHRQVGQKLDSVVQQIGITNATLSNLAGRFDGHIARNGDRG